MSVIPQFIIRQGGKMIIKQSELLNHVNALVKEE